MNRYMVVNMDGLENVCSFRRTEIVPDEFELIRSAMDDLSMNMRVCCPGTIVSWDPQQMTAYVQPCIKENIIQVDGTLKNTELPIIPNVPVVYPRCASFIMTFPLKPGDECILVFADRNYDAWWQSGGLQNPLRSLVHDLLDAFCIPGPSSMPKWVDNISEDSIMIRTVDGQAYVEIKENHDINIQTAGNINMIATGNVKIQGARIDLN